LIFFYRGLRGGEEIPLKDSEEVISFMHRLWEEGGYSKSGMESICRKVLAQQQWWGRDLTSIPHLIEMTGNYLYEIDQHGILDSLEEMP
jgi:tagaturonate reductase